jgi:hypothetical protein
MSGSGLSVECGSNRLVGLRVGMLAQITDNFQKQKRGEKRKIDRQRVILRESFTFLPLSSSCGFFV